MTANLDPSPTALFESLRSIGYTLETALADIVDNSIAARAKSISVRYIWNGGHPWVAVIDDGHGMSSDELVSAMRLGSRNPHERRSATDLGRFGLGLKTASISQCRLLTVVSLKANTLTGCHLDLDDLSERTSSDWSAPILDPADIAADDTLTLLLQEPLINCSSGTIVLWRKMDSSLGDPCDPEGERRFSANMDSARKHLELVFHRFLAPSVGRHKLQLTFNGSELTPFDPFGSPVGARQELPSEEILVQGQRMAVQPYVLPHHTKAASLAEYKHLAGDEGYLQNQGFYVYRNQRLIIKATWFRLIPKDELNKLLRVRIDIPNSLDHLWRLDVKKSQASPPEHVRRQLKRIIQKISGAGRTVFTNRATRLRNREIIPVWRREVVDGRIRYVVNEAHPLLQDLLGGLPEHQTRCLRACLQLVNGTFPYDMYYADAANDRTEFDNAPPDTSTVRQVGVELVRALRACGFHGDKLRDQLSATEFFLCSPELIDELLAAHEGRHD